MDRILEFDTGRVSGLDEKIASVASEVNDAKALLYGSGESIPGYAYRDWLDLPVDYDHDEFERIKTAAEVIRSNSEALVVIGIGGSYLGARAVIELIKGKNSNALDADKLKIFFLGNSLDPKELNDIYAYCEKHDFSVNVISKSGTTTEPAVAFRFFKFLLKKKYGDAANKRIFVTTDKIKGTLKKESIAAGYETFVVPNGVGGRYSVLTAVGLLPIAAAGVDIDQLMAGAAKAREEFSTDDLSVDLPSRYAAARNIFYREGKTIELFASYETDFAMMNEWLKQLFGESEGKDGKGLFPCSVVYTTDLHSLGQYVQDGQRLMFETVVSFDAPYSDAVIGFDPENSDGLNYIAGKTMSYVRSQALEGTVLAHTDGGVPNLVLKFRERSEFSLGYMIYFFEKACAVSGYMLGVNPFDQPGVESYKNNMFALLGKPGYKSLGEELKNRFNGK